MQNKTTKILVDGIEEEREVEYSVRRGKDKWVDYPYLEKYEHFYETANKLIIFRSILA
jgi:hypothetical protein